jgi:hypothetical protein
VEGIAYRMPPVLGVGQLKGGASRWHRDAARLGWRGFQVLPQDQEVVHHVLAAIDLTGETAALADENGVYDCFGGFGAASTFIGGWGRDS